MIATSQPATTVKLSVWAGRALSAFAILFLAFDTVIKVLNLAPAVEATTQLGYPAHLVVTIGLIQLVCLAFYVVPRTAVLGALLLTGYLGGALATQLRAEAPLFSLVFPLLVGAMVWGGLLLRNKKLRDLLLPGT
jgi:hypothetical protein